VALCLSGCIAHRSRPPWSIAAVALLCIASIVYCTRRFHQYCDEEDNVRARVALMEDGSGQEGTDEYTPRNDDNAEIVQDMPLVRVLVTPRAEEPDSGKVQNPEYQPDPASERHATITVTYGSPEHHTIIVNTSAPGYAVFRLMDYPAWTIHRDGTEIKLRPTRDDGLLTIPVPQGCSEIDIRWRTTPDISIGRVVSLLGLCVFGFVWYRERNAREVISP